MYRLPFLLFSAWTNGTLTFQVDGGDPQRHLLLQPPGAGLQEGPVLMRLRSPPLGDHLPGCTNGRPSGLSLSPDTRPHFCAKPDDANSVFCFPQSCSPRVSAVSHPEEPFPFNVTPVWAQRRVFLFGSMPFCIFFFFTLWTLIIALVDVISKPAEISTAGRRLQLPGF